MGMCVAAEPRGGEFVGVWVGDEKLAAIGIRISRWVTMHGFALNVTTDLSYFQLIVPCGIRGHGVTSLEKLLGHPVEIGDVAQKAARHFGDVFNREMSVAGSAIDNRQLATGDRQPATGNAGSGS